jgi:peptidyl-tRNA hydrolase, PTH2 family
MTEPRSVKQVIVIRCDLNMRRGKEIAQGAHASMAWLTSRLTPSSISRHRLPMRLLMALLARLGFTHLPLSEAEQQWMHGAFTKVTLQVPTLDALLTVYFAAKAAGLEAHKITDAGVTEFAGVPTITAVGIGPDYADLIDKVTDELKLY